MNVYEHLIYSNGEYENYIENLVKEISERGHEVALHAHPDASLGFYDKGLSDLSYDEQKKIIQYGKEFIMEHTGKAPISFRGGAYRVNEATFKVLEEEGFQYESSCFYGIEGNNLKRYNSLNTVCKIGNLIEFPMVRVFRSNGDFTKLDLNTLSYDEMVNVLEEMKAREGFGAAQIMFHSFSFIDQNEDASDKLYFAEGTHNAYGVDEELQKRFEDILEYISNDDAIDVVTFEQFDKDNFDMPPESADGVFVCHSEKAEKAAEKFVFVKDKDEIVDYFDISQAIDGKNITFTNNYPKDNAEYAWYIYYGDDTENLDKFMYDSNNSLTYSFDKNGTYRIKAYIKVDGEKKSKDIAIVAVNDSTVDCILK